MSITVADVLKLPSMRGARVLGGRGGLSRIVASVSVLEYADPTPVQEEMFRSRVFSGNELAITGFLNAPDDVELQLTNIQRMAQVGEVGLLLYYVGIFMKQVDPRLIALADELDFVLICMPENRMDLRYSETICDIMEAVHRDQMVGINLVGEVLEDVTFLPEYQRTVDTVLSILSDRLHASFVLLDASRRVINEAAWPRAMGPALAAVLPHLSIPVVGEWQKIAEPAGLRVFRAGIRTHDGQPMDLLIFKEGAPNERNVLQQAVEVVQLAVNIWSEHHDRLAIAELVRAILQDEPLKMRRLADIFHVDIVSLNSMWIISGDTQADRARLPEMVETARECVACFSKETVGDVYEHQLVLFMTGPSGIQEMESLTEELLRLFAERGICVTLTRGHALNHTSRVREAFLNHRTGLDAARTVFPNRKVFNMEQITFALRCQEQIRKGEEAAADAMRCLEPLRGLREEAGFVETLECFMLDAEMSMTKTAELLYVHKNTIKYRMLQMGNRLGYPIGKLPESMVLYDACGIHRLLTCQ